MEEGTFTIVDEGIFYPIVKLDEDQAVKSNYVENEANNSDANSSNKSLQNNSRKLLKNNKKKGHRKMVRRKIEDDVRISLELDAFSKAKQQEIALRENEKQKDDTEEIEEPSKKKKKRKKSKDTDDNIVVKLEPVVQNAFEFCSTADDEVHIKQEVPSNDEDVPPIRESDKDDNDMNKVNSDEKDDSSSEDDIPLAVLNKQEKRSHDDSDSDEKKVKKLKIKKLKSELKMECNSDLYYCAKCNKFCKNGKKYRSHIRKIHGKQFKCKICTLSFDKKACLEDHYNSHTGIRPYSCYLCENETFKTESSLKKHMSKYHSGKPVNEKKIYDCHLCKKVLSSASCLEDHLRLHTGEKHINCKLCDKTFSRERDLRQHLNLHDEIWKCKICQRCFLTPFKLKEHTRVHTGELPYECDKCERKFARVADFRYHIGTHLGLKPYACGDCGMRFTTSSSVTRHRLNMHQTGPRLYTCPHCPKNFHTSARLNTHIKNHENKKKFRCELCPVARGSLAELNKHVLIHGGEFRCDTCHRGFESAERLASHAARHDIAGKPYACFVCSIGYRSSQSLNKHLSTVHRNEDIPRIAPQHLCTICGQVFELKDKLNRHLKESHIVIVIGEIQSLEEDTENPVNQSIEQIDNKSAILTEDIKANLLETNNEKHVESQKNFDSTKETQIQIPTAECTDSFNNTDMSEIDPKTGLKQSVTVLKISTPIVDTVIKNNIVNNSENKERNEFSKPQENVNRKIINLNNSQVNKPPITFQEKQKEVANAITIPIVPRPIESIDNSVAKDLSASSTLAADMKMQRNVQGRVPYKPFEENTFMRGLPYNDVLAQQTNRLLHTNYRPHYEPYPQMPSNDHITNPWFLPKTNEIMPAHRQNLPRTLFETQQRYNELRMPRLDGLQMEQSTDYRNFSGTNSRLPIPNQRQEVPLQIHPRQREIINDKKYYYDTNHIVTDRKAYCPPVDQRLMPDDRRKYPHLDANTSDLSSSRHREYQNHNIPGREYIPSPLSVRDLSNSNNSESQSPHYPTHAFPSTHHLFPNFRDLQHRMLGVQDYGHARHIPPLTGMDMTNQRLNPSSPISPYNQTSPHLLENMSPMSRNSYEDMSNPHVPSSQGYLTANHLQGRGNIRSTMEPNVNNDKDGGSNEQMGNGGPYEMRVAAN